MPAGFQFFQPADVFLPFTPWAATLPDDRNWHPGIIVLGRLKPGVTREQARTEMVGITKRLEQQYPDYNTGTSADVVGLQDQMVQNVRPALLLLLGAVTFRSAHRLRQRRQSLARARRLPRTRSRHSHVDGREPRSASSANS